MTTRRAGAQGSFDPATNGPMDIVSRASRLFGEVIVAVLINKSKSSLFTVDERIEMLTECTAEYPNVKIDSSHGLPAHFCPDRGIQVIVKGLRAVSRFDYELQMGQMNHSLAEVET